MNLTQRQCQFVFEAYVQSQGDKEFLIMLRNLLDFILTHTAAEFVAKLRQVVQAAKMDAQARYDRIDAGAAESKTRLQEHISELEVVDTELSGG